MSRITVQEALKVAREFTQYNPTFAATGPRGRLKRFEHAAGAPVMRRQRIFNNAVVQVLDHLVRASGRVDELASGAIAQTTHAEGVAALRRDLVALQQEVAVLRKELAESRQA